MNIKIKTYEEFINESEINEGFFEGLLNFLKGLFNLLGDSKVKKEAEEMTDYFNDITKKYKVKYAKSEKKKDVIDLIKKELDGKKIRKAIVIITKAGKERINTNIEKIKNKKITAKNVQQQYVSQLAMIIALQESCKLPVIEKILKNPETSKKFTWIPEKYRNEPNEWYKQKECVLDKNISTSLLKVINSPKKDLENALNTFSKIYIEYISKTNNKTDALKNNDSDWMYNLLAGLSMSSKQIFDTVMAMMQNTPDDKLKETASENIYKDIENAEKSNPTKKAEKPNPNKKENK